MNIDLVDLTQRFFDYDKLLLRINPSFQFKSFDSKGMINILKYLKYTRDSKSIFKRIVVAIEYYLNLFILLFEKRKNSTVHFQAIPYTLYDKSLTFYLVSKITKKYDNKVLTVHNIIPHHLSEKEYLDLYAPIDIKFFDLFDKLIFHNQSSINQFYRLHGFIPNNYKIIEHPLIFNDFFNDFNVNNKKKIILGLFGNILKYKGYIEFLEKFAQLPENIKSNYQINLYGQLIDYSHIPIYDFVKYNHSRLSNRSFIKEIKNLDYGVLPYKRISESGLLYAYISLGIPVLYSDLDSFHETFNQIPELLLTDDFNVIFNNLLNLDYLKMKYKVEKIRSNISDNNIYNKYKELYNL